MRDYAKVSPQFWTGATGKSLRGDPEAVIVAMYLMTSPHANMIGLYHLPILYIAHETGLSIEGASKGLRRCIEGGFCSYDEASEHVFVHEMARFQIGEALDVKDKRCKGVDNELEKAPEGALQQAFREKYASAFHLAPSKGLPRGKQAPTKPRAGTGAGAGKSTRGKRAQTPLPENFAVSDRVKTWAAGKGFDRLDDHLESFRAKCQAKGYAYADWDSAFMEAIREDWAKLRQMNGANGHTPPVVGTPRQRRELGT